MRDLMTTLLALTASLPVAWAADATSNTQNAPPTSTTSTPSITASNPSIDPSKRLHIERAVNPTGAGIKMTPASASAHGAGLKVTPANSKAAQRKYQVKRLSELNQATASGTTTSAGQTTSNLPHYQVKRMTENGAALGSAGQPSQSIGSFGLPPRANATGQPSTAGSATSSSRLNAQPFQGGRAIGGTRTTTSR